MSPKRLRRAITLGGSPIRAEGSPRALWARTGVNQGQQPGGGGHQAGSGKGLRKEVAKELGSVRAKEHEQDFIAGALAGRPARCGLSRFDQAL